MKYRPRDRGRLRCTSRPAHRIQEWWERGYLKAGNHVLPERFMAEAKATLPVIEHVEFQLDDVFAALNMQQIRLKHDQQVPVWEPESLKPPP